MSHTDAHTPGSISLRGLPANRRIPARSASTRKCTAVIETLCATSIPAFLMARISIPRIFGNHYVRVGFLSVCECVCAVELYACACVIACVCEYICLCAYCLLMLFCE